MNIFFWSYYEKGGEGLSRHIIFIASFLQNKQCLYLFILKAFLGSDIVYLQSKIVLIYKNQTLHRSTYNIYHKNLPYIRLSQVRGEILNSVRQDIFTPFWS